MSDPRPSHAKITVGVVSKNHLVRIGLQAALTCQPHIRLAGEATGPMEAEALVARARPQVLIVEVESDIDLKEVVRTVKTVVPMTHIIVLSGIEDTIFGIGSVSSGIDGIVLTIQPPVVLLAMINHVCCLSAATTMHERSMESRLEYAESSTNEDPLRDIPSKAPDSSLTGREREIIALVGQALSNKDIAERLCISSITVRHHLTSIFGKFAVNNRQQLLLRAYEHGLVKRGAYQ